LLPRKMLHTNGFRLSVHFYIILPATLSRIKSSQKSKSHFFKVGEFMRRKSAENFVQFFG
jgi:hypothetical protein